MNTRRYSLLLMSLAMAFAMFATPLTPSQALSLAMQRSAGPMRVQAQQMTLVKTCTAVNNQAPALYVFSNADKPGFMVLAADDYARRIVMGYSDTDTFDPNNIPTSVQWWLDAASASVMADVQQGPAAKEQSAAPRRAERRVIEPLVTAKWGQDEPYNNMCPTFYDYRAVSGCVATAMAQIMKYHKYPIKGTGSFSYTYKFNEKEYTASADFGNTVYDWDNMLDSYDDSATSEQQDAVATLMYHCGVASKMKYAPYGSGSYAIDTAEGVIKYFDYDKSLQLLMRSWYTADEWDELVYEMLDAGLPMMYTGNDGQVGHAFVCDGIDADGYYHINWGWEGFANGYFELSDLNPLIHGIGGGDGEVGYNFDQSILYNLKPNAGGALLPSFALEGSFDAEQFLYSRNDDTKITFTGGDGFYSYTPTVLQNVTFGIYCQGDEIDQFVNCKTYESAEPWQGAKVMRAITADFTVGSYDVYPAFKDADGNMYLMHTIAGTPRSLHFEVSESRIIISPNASEGDSGIANGELYTTLKSWSRHNSSDDAIYAGNSYDFTFTLTATGKFNDKLLLVLCEDYSGKIKGKGTISSVDFEQAGTKQQTFYLDIPRDLQTGRYSICLGRYINNRLYIVGSVSDIDINEELQKTGSATIASVSLNNASLASSGKANPGVTTSGKQTVEVTMKCTKAPFVDYLLLGFFDPDTEEDVAWIPEGSMLHIKNVNDTNTLIFEGPWFGIKYDTTYGMAVFNEKDDQLSDMYYIRISSESGVATIWSDDENAEPQYYNMQGVRVSNPGPGIYIRRSGNKVTKEIIR